MSFDRHQITAKTQEPAYSPTAISTGLDATLDTTTCPNCFLLSLEPTPADVRQRYFEVGQPAVPDGSQPYEVDQDLAFNWEPGTRYLPPGLPMIRDVPAVINPAGDFVAGDYPNMRAVARIVARDGYQGGTREELVSKDTGNWYPRTIKNVDGVGLAVVGSDIRVRVVPGGTNMTPKHVDPYSSYSAKARLSFFTEEESSDGPGETRVVRGSLTLVLRETTALATMTLQASGQPYFECDVEIPSGLSGDVYVRPFFVFNYVNEICEQASGDPYAGTWRITGNDGLVYDYIQKLNV